MSFNQLCTSARLSVKKHNPEILIGLGIMTGVAACVTACMATTKLKETVEVSKEELENIDRESDNSAMEIARTYVGVGMHFVKLYGIPAALGAISITSILASHHIIKEENVAITTAYSGLQKAFSTYRERVIDKRGLDEDKEYTYGSHQEKIKVTEVDNEGKQRTVSKKVDVVDNIDDLANCCCSTSWAFLPERFWVGKSDDMFRMWVHAREDDANNMLLASKGGHLFLNEVLDMLDIDQTSYGHEAGWMLDDGTANHGHVIFHVYDFWDKNTDDSVPKHVKVIDFNCNPNILSEVF